MHRRRALLAALLLFPAIAVAWQTAVPPLPSAPKHPVVDDYNGVKVTDDYRWLEDSKSPQVVAWTQAENAHARAILDALPIRNQIQAFLKKLDETSSPAFGGLAIRGGTLFAINYEPGKQQGILVTLRSPDDLASKHVVLDPAQIDTTGSTAIQFYVPSQD